ncbi:MAG: hypothetical protein IPN69_09630 [Acidobacteria bacterium]|nr:hypothetical protein [Acidobacteriota bacterium]MBK8150017.1 hypothetical protein [Acidobacteriota bacterium]MBK8810976.1 hypothetical protein [Acidobacteriota bacterium]
MGLIPVRGNWLGLAMFVVVGGAVALVGGFVFKLSDVKTMIAVGAALVLVDFGFRFACRAQGKWVFGRDAGGYFVFLPVWILGAIVILLNSLIGAGVIKK